MEACKPVQSCRLNVCPDQVILCSTQGKESVIKITSESVSSLNSEHFSYQVLLSLRSYFMMPQSIPSKAPQKVTRKPAGRCFPKNDSLCLVVFFQKKKSIPKMEAGQCAHKAAPNLFLMSRAAQQNPPITQSWCFMKFDNLIMANHRCYDYHYHPWLGNSHQINYINQQSYDYQTTIYTSLELTVTLCYDRLSPLKTHRTLAAGFVRRFERNELLSASCRCTLLVVAALQYPWPKAHWSFISKVPLPCWPKNYWKVDATNR